MAKHDPSGEIAADFATSFRNSAPYINAFRGRSFVIVFSGEALLAGNFASLVHDFALLHTLGMQLVLVYGARPQIDGLLKERHIETPIHQNIRITDSAALQCVKEAVGAARTDIEALLSMGLANSPMAGARLRVTSGNFVIAKPYGVRDGRDFLHTGEIRRIDAAAINTLLQDGNIVLLSPLGYSPTGEVFNVNAENVATATATALQAHKLIYLTENLPISDAEGQPIRELSLAQAQQMADAANPAEDLHRILASAVQVCRHGVRRVHLLNRKDNGALLQELFTRDGVGTLISDDQYEGTRPALVDDVAGILELIEPLEQQGILVRRSREYLEMEIDKFTVVERDGMVIACAGLYIDAHSDSAELACLAVNPQYRKQGRGDALLSYIENQARQHNVKKLFVLSTQTSHWFRERGFEPSDIDALPVQKKRMYNYQRNSKVFLKPL